MKKVNYKEIKEFVPEGIVFTDGTILEFSQCEQMKEWEGCIACRDIIGEPPYFDFFYPTKNQRLRVIFDGESEIPFHRLYEHIEINGYHSFDLS